MLEFFAGLALGFLFLRKYKEQVALLNKLVYWIGLPLLMISSFSSITDYSAIGVEKLAIFFISILLTYFAAKKLDNRNTGILACYSNIGYFGTPIAFAFLGTAGVISASIYWIAQSFAMVLILGTISSLLNPVLIGVAISLLLKAAGVSVAFLPFSYITAGLLFLTGMLCGDFAGRFNMRAAAVSSAVRAFPLLAIFLFVNDPAILIFAFLPPALMSVPVLKEHGEKGETATVVLLNIAVALLFAIIQFIKTGALLIS